MEKRALALQADVEKIAIGLFETDKELAMQYVTQYSTGLALEAFSKARMTIEELQTKYMAQ